MHRLFKIMALAVLLTISVHGTTNSDYIIPAKVPVVDITTLTTEELIEHYAKEYGQDPYLLKKIAWCESKYKRTLWGDGGRAFSVFQFHRGTFDRWAKQLGKTLDYSNPIHHIELAAWAFSQGEEYRDDWTTYRAYIRGGTYSFYSKVLQGYFTVVCK